MACTGNDSERDGPVNLCRRYHRFFERGVLTLDEYQQGVTQRIIGAPDELMRSCVETIPPTLLVDYRDYLRELLVPADFKPSPIYHLAGPFTPDRIESKKVELRPKYLALYRLVTSITPAPASGHE
jgi:hypothetical protein